MNNVSVLTIGGSKNIGYFSSIRLLDLGATVTFLLRNSSVFDNDETIQKYVSAGKARLIQGDATVKEDVKRAWAAAAPSGEVSKPVDFLVCTVGGKPHFELTKGVVLSPPNLVTQSILNCLETLPTPHPKIIAISSMGITRAGHAKLPLFLKLVHNLLIASAHRDKLGTEEVLAYCAGWEWNAEDSPGTEVLSENWKSSVDLPAPGSVKSVVLVRPALLTDGACRADTSSGKTYVAAEGDLKGRWTVSRKDVAHFVVERVIRHWDEWEGKRVTVAY